jgi:hypothetical protein
MSILVHIFETKSALQDLPVTLSIQLNPLRLRHV